MGRDVIVEDAEDRNRALIGVIPSVEKVILRQSTTQVVKMLSVSRIAEDAGRTAFLAALHKALPIDQDTALLLAALQVLVCIHSEAAGQLYANTFKQLASQLPSPGLVCCIITGSGDYRMFEQLHRWAAGAYLNAYGQKILPLLPISLLLDCHASHSTSAWRRGAHVVIGTPKALHAAIRCSMLLAVHVRTLILDDAAALLGASPPNDVRDPLPALLALLPPDRQLFACAADLPPAALLALRALMRAPRECMREGSPSDALSHSEGSDTMDSEQPAHLDTEMEVAVDRELGCPRRALHGRRVAGASIKGSTAADVADADSDIGSYTSSGRASFDFSGAIDAAATAGAECGVFTEEEKAEEDVGSRPPTLKMMKLSSRQAQRLPGSFHLKRTASSSALAGAAARLAAAAVGGPMQALALAGMPRDISFSDCWLSGSGSSGMGPRKSSSYSNLQAHGGVCTTSAAALHEGGPLVLPVQAARRSSGMAGLSSWNSFCFEDDQQVVPDTPPPAATVAAADLAGSRPGVAWPKVECVPAAGGPQKSVAAQLAASVAGGRTAWLGGVDCPRHAVTMVQRFEENAWQSWQEVSFGRGNA